MIRFEPRSLRVLLALSALALFACGPDDDNNSNNSNNTTGANNTTASNNSNNSNNTNNTTASNNSNNTTGTNNTTGGFEVDTDEVEPNNVVDETTDEATPFAIGDSVGGSLDGNGDDPDVDFFKVELTAGSVFNWEITGVGAGLGADGVAAILFNSEAEINRGLQGVVGAKRGAFVPTTGTYYLVVLDPREVEEGAAGFDSPTATYSVTTSTSTLTPTAATFPGQNTGDLSDFQPDAYALTPAGDTVLAAATFAERAPVESDLDTILYVWNPTTSEVVAANDDEGDSYDSALSIPVTAGTEYYVIVDAYSAEANANYNLELGERDDAPGAPRDLVLGTPITDGIADLGGTESDADYFTTTLQPGDTVRVRVDATAAGDLVPNIAAYINGADGAEFLTEGRAAGAAAAITLHVPSGGAATDYIFVVDHQANVSNEGDTPFVGGDTYGYTLSSAAETWTAVDATASINGSIGGTLNLGSYLWYEYALTEGDVITFERTATFPQDLENADVVTTLLTDEGVTFGPGASSYVATTTGNVWLGAREVYWRGADGELPYDLLTSATVGTVAGVTFNTVTSDNSNVSKATALALSSGDVVNGQLDIQDTSAPTFNHFTVTLNQGDILTLVTEFDPDAPLSDPADPESVQNADTVISVLNDAGDELATNDEALGGAAAGPSALAWRAPAAGTYEIVVAPYYFEAFDFYFDGYYLMKLNVTPAPS